MNLKRWVLGSCGAFVVVSFLLVVVGLLWTFIELQKFGEPKTTMIQSAELTEDLAGLYIFEAVTTGSVSDVYCLSKKFGLVGYEVWARFKLSDDGARSQLIQALEKRTSMTLERGVDASEIISLPTTNEQGDRVMKRLWRSDGFTTVTLASKPNEQWMTRDSDSVVWVHLYD